MIDGSHEQFLTIFNEIALQHFYTTNETKFIWPIFQRLLENTTITSIFLKSHISCIETNTWFALFNNRELRNFNVRPTHSSEYT